MVPIAKPKGGAQVKAGRTELGMRQSSGDADLKRLRRRCEQRLAEWPLPVPFDLVTFCDTISARRCRPIVLQPLPGIGALAFWIAGDSIDLICYEQNTSRLHQEHIILHEISHIVCGHSAHVTQSDIAGRVFPHIRPDMIQRVLARSAYSTDEEREAELLASLILERAAKRDGAGPLPPKEQKLARRLDSILGE